MVELSNPDKDLASSSPWVALPKTAGEAALWRHHQLFQEAVNYYLVALGSLADSSSENRVVRDLRQRLRDSWSEFPGGAADASNLRQSLRRSLPSLAADAPLEDACDLILVGSVAAGTERAAALSLLLAQCGGEAAVQQGGRGYLPRFCNADYAGGWDCDATATAAATGKERLAQVLHQDASQSELEAIASEMDLSWTIKLRPEKSYRGDEAKARLKEGLQHLLKLANAPTPRQQEMLAEVTEDAIAVLGGHLEAISVLPATLEIPRNWQAAHDLTFASIAFMHFPDKVTQGFLRLGVKAPAKTASAKKTAKKAGGKVDLASLSVAGDDPIRACRGTRGYVFPAFTALPAWQPTSPGHPAWKEFDIAAFKEALKALNQFNQKTIEREGKLKEAVRTLAYIIGESDTPPAASDEAEEAPDIPRLGGQLWLKIQELEQELSENLNEGGWRLSSKSLRGFRDIRELWLKEADAAPERLQEIVKTYQADEKNRREIGSVQLFLTLSESRYHCLWKTLTDGDEEEPEAPLSPLHAAVHAHRLEDEVVRFEQSIRLTPAEPKYSRRLFSFTDVMPSESKKAPQAKPTTIAIRKQCLEVPLVVNQGGQLRQTRVRLHFSAPRLNRG